MRDGSTSLPNYNAPEFGKGYAMRKIGPVQSLDEVKAKCTDAVFQQLSGPYCQSNSTPTQWGVALYDGKGNYQSTTCAQSGCNPHPCSQR